MSDPDDKRENIPQPAHPLRRSERLPGQSVKPVEDDPEALERVQRIVDSDAFRRADTDLAFLDSDELRGVRLQLDYLKPELALRAHGVEETIVVFGGTRIPEPSAADRHVEKLETLVARNRGSAELERRLAIAKRVQAKSRFYNIARRFGAIVAEASLASNGRLMLMTGGGPGLMEAANRGAFDAGAPGIGLNIALPHEQYPNPYVGKDLCFSFRYFALRKLHFLLRARALVVFPGGFGTLDELFETLTLVQSRKIRPLPVVLVGERFWRDLFEPGYLLDEGVVDPEDIELFWYADDAMDAWQGILDWHKRAGSPLSCDR